jgi:LCP family protein required for cell wall assembly
MVCLGGVTAGALWSLRGSGLSAISGFRAPFGGRKRVNLLVMGIDDGQGGQGRSDTMLLVRVDTDARRFGALSIPRDTRVALGDDQFGKINAAHARGGPALAARAVSELTGLPIDYTLQTDFGGFSRLVDLVGGIDLDVDRAMDYEDHWAGLSIHLKPGLQHMDGDKAIQYVRFRKSSTGHAAGDGSDISRIGRQQKFLEALAARAVAGTNLFRLPELIRMGRQQVRTDLSNIDLLYLAGLAKEIGAQQLNVLTVPGKTEVIDGQSYWLPDRQQLTEIVQQLDGKPASDGAPVSVAVLNASRRRGLGRQIAAQLEQRGYRIATVATNDAAEERSRVIAAEPCRAGAEAIADVLDCGCAIGSPAPELARDAQVTVIVGQDFAADPGSRHRG